MGRLGLGINCVRMGKSGVEVNQGGKKQQDAIQSIYVL
jgi:hypothetical protein